MDRTDLVNKVAAAMQDEIGVTGDPTGDYDIGISAASTVAVDVLSDELGIREGSRVLGPEQCCEQGCNGGACESCTCCGAGWCVTGRDGLPEDPEDLAIWLKYASGHNAAAKALADALARVAAGDQVAEIAARILRMHDGGGPRLFGADALDLRRALDVEQDRRR